MLIKKRKGLFYLIITVAIISVMAMGCKNKPTGATNLSGLDENVTVEGGSVTAENFKTFVGKTIHSIDSIDENYDGKGDDFKWFWAEFDDTGIKFDVVTTSSVENKPTYRYSATLSSNPLSDNVANFETGKGPNGTVKATIKFELEGNKISDIIVNFTEGTSFTSEIKCRFLE